MLDALFEGNDETLLEVPQIFVTVHSLICNYCTFYVLHAQPDLKYFEAFTVYNVMDTVSQSAP